MTVSISPKKLASILSCVTLLLLIAHAIAQVIRLNYGAETAKGWVRVLDMDGEGSIPAWFSSSLLLFCSAMLGIVASSKKRLREPYARYWMFLSIGFLVMSVDETAQFHEALGAKLRTAFDTSGFLMFTWVVPAAAFIAFLAVAYRGFLLELPVMTRRLFILAGAVYVGGAVGLEMLEGKYVSWSASWPAGWIFLTTVQETFEIVGLIVFLYALVNYAEQHSRKSLQAEALSQEEESNRRRHQTAFPVSK